MRYMELQVGLCKLILNYWNPQTSCDYYQPLPSTKRFSIRIKTIRHKSAVSYYLNKGDKIYTDEIVKKVGLPCL
jgi:D-alanine-D-alanine ligase